MCATRNRNCSHIQIASNQIQIQMEVENKAWKPGVARPSKSKARWVNTTNKMQVFIYQFMLCFISCICITNVSGFHCSWGKYPETASKQQRCFQVVPIRSYFLKALSHLILQALISGFRTKAQKKQKTARKNKDQSSNVIQHHSSLCTKYKIRS